MVVAGRNQLLGPLLVGLLGKAAHPGRAFGVRKQGGGAVAGFDVSIAGFGAGGLHAEHHHVGPGGRDADGLLDHGQKGRFLGNDVVGGKHAQHRMRRDALDEEGRQSGRGRGVARRRLADHLRRRHLLKLSANGV